MREHLRCARAVCRQRAQAASGRRRARAMSVRALGKLLDVDAKWRLASGAVVTDYQTLLGECARAERALCSV